MGKANYQMLDAKDIQKYIESKEKVLDESRDLSYLKSKQAEEILSPKERLSAL